MTNQGYNNKTTEMIRVQNNNNMKRFIKIAGILVFIIAMTLQSFAQTPTYSCVATADTLMTSKVYQFDVIIYRTGSNLLYLNNYQLSFKINNSAGILNGGNITGAYVPGSSALPGAFLPGGVSIFNIGGIIYARVNGCTSSSNGTLIPTTGLKIGSFRLTNTNEFGQINPNTIWWDGSPATTYVYAIVPPAPTGTVVEISTMNTHTTTFTDPIFNAPVIAFNVTGTGNYCSGASGLAVGIDGSQLGVMYRLIKNGTPVGSYLPGTGSALSFGVQTAGTYTVTAYRKATYISNTMMGSAVITQSVVNPTIAGNNSACTGSAGNVYTTEALMTNYIWSVSAGGTVTAGGTASSNTVTVTWNTAGPQTVSVNYTNSYGCTATSSTVYNVSVNALPVPAISGPTSNICTGSGYSSYTTQTGNTNYNWTISSGGSIVSGQGTSAVSVSWTTSGSQWVGVSYTSSAGCTAAAPTQLNVTVSSPPAAAGVITGTSSLCAGTTGVAYSVPPVSNATTYLWNLPPGASIASGAGTNSITVDFSGTATSGDIVVYGNNFCGNGGSSPAFPVTVNAIPSAAGNISGDPDVCLGSAGIAYSVPSIPGATSYTWSLPAGATIASGANTNSITVDFSMTAISGNITVFGSSSCGTGPSSPVYAVTVYPKPPKPVVTATGYLLTSSAPSGNQWYWNGNAVAGGTQQTLTVPAANSGYYWSIVTLNNCSSDSSNHVYIAGVGVKENEGLSFNVYPVPNDGLFTATVSSSYEDTYRILVYNTLGAMVYKSDEFRVIGKHDERIDVRKLPAGVYSVVFKSDQVQVVKKIFINH